ncbi:GAF domain-containing sensor histidine kinase [Conexibacter woesei]|uniref:GAF sensor signal transduction histidine kinase n=1 Tax=Conexibacter woesei (strain DSM 14684 / CCUG 47730 / CIP 108061 / JCM 11494 / NBRC 100937 / ID131577) TaxID=469383 RepID=D3FEQ1_CONWI|nr:GAF domain-containing sensor histidine kinase [Conexibacter woesei]ADB49725.1 GAF sensor signal transduction histidine kinase [Conexibacter woesei DSM 14684]
MADEPLDEARLRRLIAVGRSLVQQLDLEALLAQIVAVAREVTGARYAAIGVLDEARAELERFLTRGIDEATRDLIGDPPRGHGILGVLIRDPRPVRLADLGDDPRSYGFPPHHPPMHSFLGVPIVVRGRAWGNLYLTDKEGGEFAAADEEAAVILADWAAVAIDNAGRFERQRLRDTMAAAEQERRRWARELHDETLQGLGGLQVLLSSALRRSSEPSQVEGAVRAAVEEIGTEIEKLRTLITELRPAALDELGLEPALESLAGRVAAVEGIVVTSEVVLADGERRRLPPDLETAVYRLVQEALTNAVKHARAERVDVRVTERDGCVELTVRDDGAGFDVGAPRAGFGLLGMEERVALAGGTLAVQSRPGAGTTIRATLSGATPRP